MTPLGPNQSRLLLFFSSLFSVQRHEWSKALMLLGVAALLGVGFSVSRAASEAMFLTRFGVQYLPYLQLVNPLLVLVAAMIYGAFASRIPNDRLLVYTALIPIPLILCMRFLIVFDLNWTYFLLFAFALAYASVLTTSWAVYLPGHYDVQEAKRLLPFISSGLLIGTVVGGIGVALCVPVMGAANVLFIWMGTLLVIIAMVQGITRIFTAMGAEARKVKPSRQQGARKQSGILQNLQEGVTYSRASALFLTTAIASIATAMALQLVDFEYSKIFAEKFPNSTDLTAFLGIVDGLTTVVALAIQWFVVPRCIRGLGVQGTNLLFPYTLTAAFGGLLMMPVLIPAIFARFTRYSLMPSLRGTTRTLILNAVPRKNGALVRSFNTGIVLPAGQVAGAVTLLALKGIGIPSLLPVAGLLISAVYVFYSYKQNTAYGGALLDLLKEDKIYLLDLEDDELRQLDEAAVATVGERLSMDQAEVCRMATESAGEPGELQQEIAQTHEEVSLAAIELLRTVGSPQAFAALSQHLPYASPRLTAMALDALATIGGTETAALVAPYIDDAEPQVRIAALNGLRRLQEPSIRQRAESLLDDLDVQVRAAALSITLADADGALSERASRIWKAMLESPHRETRMAALSVFPSVPETPLQKHVYRALDHTDLEIRRAALRVLGQLATAKRITEVKGAVLRSLVADDVELRQLTLQVLTAIGTDAALHHMLVLLDDEQPWIRETLIKSVKSFGKRAREPLFECLRSPRSSLLAKESALLALSGLDGVQVEQFQQFWEAELQDVYRYKLMLTCLQAHTLVKADAFVQVALSDAYEHTLSLLVHVLAIWTSPEVARLVDNSLHDTDRSKRAQALEALESLTERRFTRLFLPILEAHDEHPESWKEVAQRQWNMTFTEVPVVLDACRQCSHKWIQIGALLSERARTESTGEAWAARLKPILASTTDDDVRNLVGHMLGVEGEARSFALTEIMLFLKGLPLFSSMSLDQLRTIADHLEEREASAGELIFHQGDLSQDLYIITSGKVRIVQKHADTVHTIATLATGDFFGDMAIFEERPRLAAAVAAERATLLMLSPERFRRIVLREPAISFEIFRELSARLRRLQREEGGIAV